MHITYHKAMADVHGYGDDPEAVHPCWACKPMGGIPGWIRKYVATVEPLTNDHPHQRPTLSYDHISCDGQWFLFVYESLTSDHPSYSTTPMWFWGWSYKRGSTVYLVAAGRCKYVSCLQYYLEAMIGLPTLALNIMKALKMDRSLYIKQKLSSIVSGETWH